MWHILVEWVAKIFLVLTDYQLLLVNYENFRRPRACASLALKPELSLRHLDIYWHMHYVAEGYKLTTKSPFVFRQPDFAGLRLAGKAL